MNEKELQKRIKEGSILAQVSFELVGNPKEHIETTMKGFMDNIKSDSQITVLNEELGEAEEVQGSKGLWSTFADTEMLVKGLDKFIWLCVNFMPASIEIIAPEELRIKEKEMTNWLNDWLAKLHEIAVSVRQTNVKDETVIKTMNALIQNAVILATEHYHSPADIAKKIGLDEKSLQPFLDALVKQGKLEKKGDSYNHKGGKQDGAKKKN